MLWPGKAARNDPKCHYCRIYRAVFILVVAQPIQDLSAVPITHKTVGVGLPRLWCGAIGLAVSACGSTKTGVFFILLLYMVGVGGWGVAEFSSLRRKRSKADPMKYWIYANVPVRFGSIPTVLSFTTSRSSRLAMKILIEMTPENYDRFLSKLLKASAPYTLLKNGVVTGGSAKENRIIEIACEMFEAKMLLHVAQMLCPEAALEIDKGVMLARPFQA